MRDIYQCPVCQEIFLYEEDLELHWQHHAEDDPRVLVPQNLWHWIECSRGQVLWDMRAALTAAQYREPKLELEQAMRDMEVLESLEYLTRAQGQATRVLYGW